MMTTYPKTVACPDCGEEHRCLNDEAIERMIQLAKTWGPEYVRDDKYYVFIRPRSIARRFQADGVDVSERDFGSWVRRNRGWQAGVGADGLYRVFWRKDGSDREIKYLSNNPNYNIRQWMGKDPRTVPLPRRWVEGNVDIVDDLPGGTGTFIDPDNWPDL